MYKVFTNGISYAFISKYELKTKKTTILLPSGIGGLFTSVLDAKLAPEHLLRLCLEHEKKFVSSHTDVHRFNFYKVSQSSAFHSQQ